MTKVVAAVVGLLALVGISFSVRDGEVFNALVACTVFAGAIYTYRTGRWSVDR